MLNAVKTTRSILLVSLLIATMCGRAHGQSAGDGWNWSVNGNVFAGDNYQQRESADIGRVESQNWLMGMGVRQAGRGRVTLTTMFSLEPFTLKKIGSAQVFQTGETFNNAPLIDYQHPHDLISTLAVTYARPLGSWTLTTIAAPVGSPALGPPPFMHRPSAIENPQSPLAHHHLDSVHITPGVLLLGLSRDGLGIETSWFRGREPDETRTDVDLGALDSWSVRGSWARGPWTAQVSGARVNEPEPQTPGDMTRLMASVGHTHAGPISTALFGAWGQNREEHATSNALLFESTISWLDKNYLYSRAELVGKDLPHTHGGIVQPMHEIMNVGAFTLGYTRDIATRLLGRVGIGGDMTMYYVPRMLQESYGAPLSFHAFVRYRFTTTSAIVEHHH